MRAEKIINIANTIVDRFILLTAIFVFLVACYFAADAGYVYYSASTGGIRGRQQQKKVEEVIRELSSDAIAWLNVEDTSIDYPIMQCDNNSKYLNTDPYGDYSLSGSIFADYRNAGDFSDAYTIVYGHHMTNNIMFGALDLFEDPEYFANHRNGTLTINGVEHHLNIFAFGVMQATEQEIFDPEYASNVRDYIDKRALICYPPGDGNIVLLSTCRDPGLTTRTLVFAEITD